jgi:16S rRNA processing protein RimM
MIVLGRIVAPFGVKAGCGFIPSAMIPKPGGRCRSGGFRGCRCSGRSWQARAVSKRSSCTATVSWPSWPASMTGMPRKRWAVVISVRRAMPCRAPAQDEYYWADLIGLEVVNLQDQPLGRVTSLIETGANQVLVVSDGERERLLPFVEQVVGKVDVPGGVIRADWGLDW